MNRKQKMIMKNIFSRKLIKEYYNRRIKQIKLKTFFFFFDNKK
jgi:hypothetical protein